MNPLPILASSGLGLGLLIIVALLVRRGANRRANYCLAASLACSMCLLLIVLLLQQGVLERSPWLRVVALPYVLATPLIYAYTRVMTDPGYRPGLRALVHLWPLLLLLVFFGASSGVITPESFDRARGGWPPNRLAVMAIALYCVQTFYLLLSLLQLRSHRDTVAQSFSYRESVSLRWLQILISVYLALTLFTLMVALVRLIPGVDLWPRAISSTSITLAICYLIGFFGLTQSEVFGQREAEDKVSDISSPEVSGLSPEQEQDYWRRLETHMTTGKPYLDHELRIADLARQLEIPVAHLSQTINRQAGQNFFDFVSRYRVARALELLQAGDASVTRIAEDAGFNSQSAFYRQFKKATGLTPKQYQRQAGGP